MLSCFKSFICILNCLKFWVCHSNVILNNSCYNKHGLPRWHWLTLGTLIFSISWNGISKSGWTALMVGLLPWLVCYYCWILSIINWLTVSILWGMEGFSTILHQRDYEQAVLLSDFVVVHILDCKMHLHHQHQYPPLHCKWY